MNVFKCARGQLQGGTVCAFMLLREDRDNGELVDKGCMRCGGKGHDDYNVYPEHRSDGSIVNQNDDPYEPNDLKLGPTIIWENYEGAHETGLTYFFRDFPADIHPRYHKEERNIPSKSHLEIDDVGDIFGGEDPVLVSPGWSTESFYGHSKVEVCKNGIYGRYDRGTDLVLPVCLKSHMRDIPGWKDYCQRKEMIIPRTFFIQDATDESISKYCDNRFKSKDAATRIKDAMLAIKDGKYVDIWTLMNNNFVGQKEKVLFMEQVSLKTYASLYKGNVNLQNYCELYTFLGKAEWVSTYTDPNGKKITTINNIHKDVCKSFKQNLVNWILNSPQLQNTRPAYEQYRTSERYWFVTEMLVKAMREGILPKKAALPTWLVRLTKESRRNPKYFTLFKKPYNYNTCSQEIKNEYCDALILRLDTPAKMYPGIVRIKDIIDTEGMNLAWYAFRDLLYAGKRWNTAEVQTAWDYFKRAWMMDDPTIFWEWVDNVEKLPYESEYSISREEFEERLKLTGGHGMETPSEFISTINFGALDIGLGDGNISSKRAFAANLTDCMKDPNSFDVYRRTLTETYDGKARVKHYRECNNETFWNELIKMGGLKGDREKLKTSLSKEMHEELLESDSAASMESISETGFDDADLRNISSLNIYSGTFTPLNGGTGSWQEEE